MTALPDGEFGDRVRARLRDGRLIWLVTVGADGTPQPNPVWFLWDAADTLLVYNRADAYRLTHLDVRPAASMAQVSGSVAQFGVDYPVAVEFDIRRVRGH